MSAREPVTRPGLLARVLLTLVRAYRAIPKGPVPRCRFDPTCSAYALGALRAHGAGRGTWLAARRIARCHPFNPGGLDPVPPPTPTAVRPQETARV